MVYRYKEAVLLFFGVLASYQLLAQGGTVSGNGFRTWSVGVNAGNTTAYTFLAGNARQDFTSPDLGLGYGIYFKDQFTYSLGLQADFMAGNLKADHSLQYEKGIPLWATSTTKINWSASLSINYTLAHINLQDQKGFLQPYFTGGAGFMSSTTDLKSYLVKTATHLSGANNVFIPIGFGLKFDLTPNINLDLGYQVNFVSADNLDGFKYGTTNDRFSYTHVGLEFSIGSHLKRQLATESRIVALEAENAAEEQVLKLKIDQQQTALDQARHEVDKVTNDLDVTNVRLAKLIADSDGDGIPDLNDKCPNTPPGTRVDATGCPIGDVKLVTPVTGLKPAVTATEPKPVTPAVTESRPITPLPIIEPKPTAPKPKAPVVESKSVKPPISKPVVTDNITEGDRSMVDAVIGNITFYPGKYVIREQSFRGLSKVAQLVISKNLFLKLETYTENTGNAEADLKLAKARAEAVKESLTIMGVKSLRIETLAVSSKPESDSKLNGHIKASLSKK